MEKILTRFRALRAEMDDLIAQMEALGSAPAPVPAKKSVGRPKKVEAQKDTAVVETEKVDKRRQPMSEEKKAKLKAGRDAAKARRDAERAAAAAAAAGGGDETDVVFEEDEEEVPAQPIAKTSESPREICRKCVVNLKHGTDHRRCFFKGLEEGLWSTDEEWAKDCQEFAKRFAPESK